VNVVGADFSLEAWIRTTASSPTGNQAYEGNGLIWSDYVEPANDFILAILNDQVSFLTGNPDTSITAGDPVNDGRWHLVVATREQGVIGKLYLDGVEVGSEATSDALLTDNTEIRIGGNVLDGRYYEGSVDEVANYSRVLTGQEILEHRVVGILEVFCDGFESGHTSSWSATVPQLIPSSSRLADQVSRREPWIPGRSSQAVADSRPPSSLSSSRARDTAGTPSLTGAGRRPWHTG
jgi:hypothetical protein